MAINTNAIPIECGICNCWINSTIVFYCVYSSERVYSNLSKITNKRAAMCHPFSNLFDIRSLVLRWVYATHCKIQFSTGFEFSIKHERESVVFFKTIWVRSRIAENTYTRDNFGKIKLTVYATLSLSYIYRSALHINMKVEYCTATIELEYRV